MKMLRFIDRVLSMVEGWFIILFLLLMVALTFFQVIMRSLYTHAHIQWANSLLGHIDWAEPFVRLLVLWITFIGASLLTGDNKHIKIDLMSSLLPRKWLPLRELVLSLACILISALMLKASIDYIRMEMDFGGYLFLKLPTWVGQLILPAGFLVILFRFFLKGIEQVVEIFGRTKT